MSTPVITLPSRPLRVHPPGTGFGSNFWTLAWSLGLAAAAVFFLVPPIADLVSDFAIADQARPVAGGHVDGSCRVGMVVVTRCDARLTAPTSGGGPQRLRKVDYFFVDFHPSSYHVAVVADPARPELLSTDLALEKLRNRVITLVTLGPLFGALGIAALVFARRRLAGSRATGQALSNQVLRPVLLRMEHYAVGHWTVSAPSSGRASAPRTWEVSRTARPIVMDPERKLVLGVTAGDGAIAMPVDSQLRWIELDAPERRQLLEQLGPERLGGWLGALGSTASTAERHRLRRMVRGLTVTALVLAAVALAAAWVAFADRDTGNGEFVVLVRGDEGPTEGTVRLKGVAQRARTAQTERVDARAAHLEVWVPFIAPSWREGEPVSWIAQDPPYDSASAPVAATWSGTVSTQPLPQRARAELGRRGVVLASAVRVLAVSAPVGDPLHVPALVLLGLCGALAAGLLGGAGLISVKVRQMDAIFR